ncbi:LacI family DNA-binding transcriptional regulator [Saccharopolyspora sp. 5N708]|uniref:LacI family DNA-binding transcriptional regulator n=1 Tax=Saccharopolyspora sp. 5N708 TaxID=3457424 RepID=UPI003FD6BE05
MTNRQGRARLVDVAERAGVTKSVVSRVLNDDPTLSARPETRRRVLAAAAELGYRAHAGARALAGSSARAIAMLIPDLTNPVYARILRGAYRCARLAGYVVLVTEDAEGTEADESITELVAAGRVDGLLIASARPDHPLLAEPTLADVPHVFVNRGVPGSGRNVLMDGAQASAAAVRHLLAHGHRAIGHVAGPAEIEPSQGRERGFHQEMRAHELVGSMSRGEFTGAGGAAAAIRLLAEHPELTAIYVSMFSQAVGVVHAIRQSGRRIPEDVSVISYDDLPFADYLEPPLTTVAMPVQDLGQAAVGALLAQLRGEAPHDVLVPATPQVVGRRSVCFSRVPDVRV